VLDGAPAFPITELCAIGLKFVIKYKLSKTMRILDKGFLDEYYNNVWKI
jgi:hypothetical protein